jgi:AraC-like DNA-binding protein
MNNLYEDIKGNPHFNRLEIGDLLFAEYTCPLESKQFGIWTQHDYLVHVVSGKKTWHTPDGSWPVSGGETLFFKKGAAVVEQHFESDFCVMIFFIPDSLTREVATQHLTDLGKCPVSHGSDSHAIPVQSDLGLSGFFTSMRTYFSGKEKPTEPLLRLKIKELILSILLSRTNPELSIYLRMLANSDGPSLPNIMEVNFRYRLSLDEFARLSHRSLSSFKRDFSKHFGEPPGRWILARRLDYAAALLRSNGEMNITEIVFDSGFEDVSHFNKAFKKRFETSPTLYRKGKDG